MNSQMRCLDYLKHLESLDKMEQYIIRTSEKEKKTQIMRVGTPVEIVGTIYTDFNLHLGNRGITEEDIVGPLSNRSIGKIELYQNKNIIAIKSKKKEISAYTLEGEYKEEEIIIPYRKISKESLLAKPEYLALEEMGLTHAYFLGELSSLSQVFCFEKGSDLSGIVYAKESDDISALKGLSLVLAKRIENQKFIFEFMKR